jgi:hypothetical protein
VPPPAPPDAGVDDAAVEVDEAQAAYSHPTAKSMVVIETTVSGGTRWVWDFGGLMGRSR